MFDNDESLFTAMRAGAHGYLVKGAERDEMIWAIEAVAVGEVVFSVGVAARALAFFAAAPAGGRAARPTPELTDREVEILQLIAQVRSKPGHRASHTWPTRPCATMYRTSPPSCRRPTAPRPSSALARQGWASRPARTTAHRCGPTEPGDTYRLLVSARAQPRVPSRRSARQRPPAFTHTV